MNRDILIVDDDPDLRSELRSILEDYNVIEASSGEEALKLLKRANEVGLVILDIMMSGVNGLDLLPYIKKTDPELKVIILTGHSSKDIAIEALKSHADDYIEKPICVDNIRESVEKMLQPAGKHCDQGVFDLKAKVERVESFVKKNWDKKTGLEDAAKVACLSPKYLSRIFKEQTGTGFSEYKLKIKIAEAKKLLGKSGFNVNQISDKLGYENTESFIRQFKKLTKKTPTEYRNKVQNK